MGFKLLVLALLIQLVAARIRLDVNVDKDQKVNISYTGTETRLATDDDLNAFNAGKDNLARVYRTFLDNAGRVTRMWLKTFEDTNAVDLCKSRKPEDLVNRVLSIKSASVKGITMKPVIVVSQDFENSSNHTIKVNTGISHTIENTLTTAWSRGSGFTVSQDIEYELNVEIVKIGGRTGFSGTENWGSSEEKSKTETIGTNSGMEVELKPGEAVTAVLSANAGYLEIEVVHKATLKGYMGMDFHYYVGDIRVTGMCESIEPMMEYGHISNEITTTETIKVNYYAEAKLRVYEKKTGLLIL